MRLWFASCLATWYCNGLVVLAFGLGSFRQDRRLDPCPRSAAPRCNRCCTRSAMRAASSRMDFCVLSRLDCNSASFGYPGPNLAESSFNLACVWASSPRRVCSSVSEPVTPADAPLSMPFPASPEISSGSPFFTTWYRATLHDARRLCLLQLGGCLLQPVERGSEDLLVPLGIGLAKRKHTRVMLQVDDFGLQIFALLAQVVELVSQPYTRLAGGVVTGLKIVINQSPAPGDSRLRRQSGIGAEIVYVDQTSTGDRAYLEMGFKAPDHLCAAPRRLFQRYIRPGPECRRAQTAPAPTRWD